MVAGLGDREVVGMLVGVEGAERPVLAVPIGEVGIRRAATVQPLRDLLK
jgi:hypothetical protein